MRIGHGYDVHRLTEGRDLILGGVKIHNIVKIGVLRIRRVKRKILHQAEHEAIPRLGRVGDRNAAAVRHHHAQIFFQLLRREIHHGG